MAYVRANNGYGPTANNALARKFDVTPMYENASQLNNYQRNMLMHQGPDPILFEEEAKRDNQSESRLNIRHHGSRSKFVPYHPEIFTELTERDPRGTSTDPDMRKLADQAKFRVSRYTKYYNDSDNSVPEQSRSEARIIRDKRDMFYWIKDRMKWFSTSKDGRAAGRTMGYKKGKDIENITLDGQMIDLNNAPYTHRGDHTTILSNYTQGWYNNTTDHIFSIAKYGPLYSHMDLNKVDLRGAQDAARLTHSEIVEYRGNLLPKSVVYTMKRIATERTEELPPHFQLSLEEKIRPMTRVNKFTGQTTNDYDYDHVIVENIVNATRRNVQHSEQSGIVVRANEESADRDGREDLNVNIKPSETFYDRPDNKFRRNTNVHTQKVEYEILDYSGVTPKERNNYMSNREQNKFHVENRVSQHRVRYEHQVGKRQKNSNRKQYRGDLNIDEFNTLDRRVGKMENKSTSRRMLSAEYENMNDALSI